MPGDRKSSHLFVSVQKPGGTPDQDVKRTVRSWITKGQHDRRRGRPRKEQQDIVVHEIDANERLHLSLPCSIFENSNSSSEDSKSSERTPNGTSPNTPSEEWTFMAVDPTGQQTGIGMREVKAHVARRQHQHRRELAKRPYSTIQVSNRDQTPSPRSAPGSFMDQVSSPQFSPPLLSPELEDPADTLSVYARQLGYTASSIWEYYRWQELEHGRLFRAQYGQFDTGWAPRCLHPLILSDPAMLATTVLFTGCLMRYLRCQTVMTSTLLHIRSLAYSFVQAAIDNDAEQLTDATLLAVIKLALFEVVFGHRTAFLIHMEGIVQMVSLRKGLANLGMSGYTAHLLVWFDANLSAVAKTPRFLAGEAFLASIEHVEPDKESFVLGVEPIEQLDSDYE